MISQSKITITITSSGGIFKPGDTITISGQSKLEKFEEKLKLNWARFIKFINKNSVEFITTISVLFNSGSLYREWPHWRWFFMGAILINIGTQIFYTFMRYKRRKKMATNNG